MYSAFYLCTMSGTTKSIKFSDMNICLIWHNAWVRPTRVIGLEVLIMLLSLQSSLAADKSYSKI